MSTDNGGGTTGTADARGPDAAPPAGMWDLVTPLVHRALRTPGLGPTRGAQAALARLAEAAWDAGIAGTRYSAIVARVWADVAADLATQAPGVATDPTTALDPRKLLERFYEVAEKHFSEAFATDRYIDAQAELGATGLAYRVAEQPIAQRLLNLLHAASLADVDAAHRNVQDLRRTVRELRRRVRALERTAGAADAPASSTSTTSNGSGS
ncbi:hypothetical protein BH23ACT10_BH23ACT10_17930 [soil metagenome]